MAGGPRPLLSAAAGQPPVACLADGRRAAQAAVARVGGHQPIRGPRRRASSRCFCHGGRVAVDAAPRRLRAHRRGVGRAAPRHRAARAGRRARGQVRAARPWRACESRCRAAGIARDVAGWVQPVGRVCAAVRCLSRSACSLPGRACRPHAHPTRRRSVVPVAELNSEILGFGACRLACALWSRACGLSVPCNHSRATRDSRLGIRMTLLTTERLFWRCGAHTAEPKSRRHVVDSADCVLPKSAVFCGMWCIPGRSPCHTNTAGFGNTGSAESASRRRVLARQCELHSARIAAQR